MKAGTGISSGPESDQAIAATPPTKSTAVKTLPKNMADFLMFKTEFVKLIIPN
jgi:hypothetical protein